LSVFKSKVNKPLNISYLSDASEFPHGKKKQQDERKGCTDKSIIPIRPSITNSCPNAWESRM
jgi:hypothetical protein